MSARRVTMQDVAAASGVSRAAVSLVVRDSPQISAETKARVRATIDRLGYVYDRRAAVMRARRTMTVGLVVTDVRNPFFAELTMALESRLQESGYALLLGYSQDDADRQDRLLEVMVEHHVDGVLLVPANRTSPASLRRRLESSGTPHVLIARRVRGHGADYVGIDNVRAGDLLGEHLGALGCGRIAFLGGPESTARSERARGLALGLRRRGIALDTSRSLASSADRAGGAAATQRLLAAAPPPDAIACYSDVVAFGVLTQLRAAGLEPGRDVAVASFDDLAASRSLHPPLTSVATHPARVGAEAARLLQDQLDGVQAASRRTLLAPELFARASTLHWGGARTKAGAGAEARANDSNTPDGRSSHATTGTFTTTT